MGEESSHSEEMERLVAGVEVKDDACIDSAGLARGDEGAEERSESEEEGFGEVRQVLAMEGREALYGKETAMKLWRDRDRRRGAETRLLPSSAARTAAMA